jgi:methionine biosynthesis protein MetW
MNRAPARARAASAARPSTGLRIDLRIIAEMVRNDTRVLDIGCGDGVLLEHLSRMKNVDGRGLEISQSGVNACVARGLSVIQGDADFDLVDYPDDAFDYVILSQTIQATERPRDVLSHMLRIGKRAIVSFPNFGHWKVRLDLLFRGRMPITGPLGHPWHATPNIHLCTVRDFTNLVHELGAEPEQALYLDEEGRPHLFGQPGRIANLIGAHAIFLLSKRGAARP